MDGRRASRRLLLVPLAAAVAALSFASAAYAHTLINSGNVYDTGTQCVSNFTAQAHSYNSVEVNSLRDTADPFGWPRVSCGYQNVKPNGYLSARWESWKWGQNVGAWVLCGTQGWEYGGGYRMTVGRSTTGCGGGYYGVEGGAFVYNGGWVGGWLWTGYEWLWS